MNRILFFILIVIIAPKVCIAQNMVSNSSFEIVTNHICDNRFINKDSINDAIVNSYKNIANWTLISPSKVNYVTTFLSNKYRFTPKNINSPYIDTCYKELLSTYGFENADLKVRPHSGSSYIRNWKSECKTLFMSKLLTPLEKGRKYYVEAYYRVQNNEALMYSNPKAEKGGFHFYFYDNLGISFTNTDYSEPKRNKSGIFIQPKFPFEMKDSSAFKNWTKFSCVYEATSDFEYIIIGNFKEHGEGDDDIILKMLEKNGFFQMLYYFFDDIKVIPYEEHLKEQFSSNESIELKDIFFEINSAELKEESFSMLNDLNIYLKYNPKKKITISGHTDNTGNEKTNIALSLKRANSIKEYLSKNGINSNRISTKGFGSAKPIVPNINDENKSKNRRIEIKIF